MQRTPEDAIGEVAVLVPALDEATVIGPLVERLSALPEVDEVLVVDDGSADATGAVAARAGARVLVHPRRRGNGACIKTALAATTADLCVIVDGDGQHDPDDVPRLLAALARGADLAVGARTAHSASGPVRNGGNRLLCALASFMTGHPVPDLTSGLRAFRRAELLPWVPLLPEGFSTPTTSTLAYLHSGRRVDFLPIVPRPRLGPGRTRTRLVRDAPVFPLLAWRVTTRFRPWRVWGPVLALTLATALALAVTGAGAGSLVAGVLAAPLVAFASMLAAGFRVLAGDRSTRRAPVTSP